MRNLLLQVREEEMVLAVLENGILSDLAVESAESRDLVGGIYKGVVKNVVPSLNGMFVDIGIAKNGFLRMKNTRQHHAEGETILVQVEKDSTETKGPLLTEKISLPGKYAVALFHTDYIGISKKIRKEEEREKLRLEVQKICPAGMGVIVRTAAESVEPDIFRRDLMSLRNIGEIIRKRFRVEKGPVLLYREGDLAVRAFRDYMTGDTECLITNDREIYRRLLDMASRESEEEEKKIRLYESEIPLFTGYHVDEQLEGLFRREVPLESGGSIVIDYTEALTAIDVNSGSFRSKGLPHSELAFLVNCSAAKEIARQIRLRAIGGIIMVDFLDMDRESHKEKLLELLKQEVRKDHIKTVVCGMTSLGLVEVTRKRTGHRLYEKYYENCPCCHGTGKILTGTSMAERIFRDLEKKRMIGPFKTGIRIRCCEEAAEILNKPINRQHLRKIVNHTVLIESQNYKNRSTYEISFAEDWEGQ